MNKKHHIIVIGIIFLAFVVAQYSQSKHSFKPNQLTSNIVLESEEQEIPTPKIESKGEKEPETAISYVTRWFNS
tara:strand:+ start:33276 stop:33497 length:222 start_codon:yes stop_codon:yes gene_type:complete